MRKNCPIYRMSFQNHLIKEDATQILWFAVLNCHSNYAEREKIKKSFRTLVIDILGFNDPKEAEVYNNIISEDKLLYIVSKIESKLYDKSFSFLRQENQGKI